MSEASSCHAVRGSTRTSSDARLLVSCSSEARAASIACWPAANASAPIGPASAARRSATAVALSAASFTMETSSSGVDTAWVRNERVGAARWTRRSRNCRNCCEPPAPATETRAAMEDAIATLTTHAWTAETTCAVCSRVGVRVLRSQVGVERMGACCCGRFEAEMSGTVAGCEPRETPSTCPNST